MDEAAIIAAVDRLNEQLQLLPNWVPCGIDGLYPEFDYADHGPDMYLALVEVEMCEAEGRLMRAEEGEKEALTRLVTMLMQCAIALREAGVE